MDEQALVNQMLEMQAANTPQGNTDPIPPVTNAGQPEPTPVVTPAPEGAPTEGNPAVVLETPPAAPAKPSAPPPAPAPVVEKPVNLEDTFDKSSKAFAEMRLELKRKNDLLMRYGAFAKIDSKDPTAVENVLNQLITAEEAKAKNIDPVVLRTLQDQEAKLAAYEQEEIKKEANSSFVELQKQFNLDTRDLTAFAKQLSAEGINPFTTRGINLAQQYLSLNYQKLIDRAREQGRVEEAERQKRVAQSTVPGGQTGQSPNQQTPVTPQSSGNGFDDLAKILGIR